VCGPAARYDHHAGNDDFAQAGALFRLMTDDQKAQLVANLALPLKTVSKAIQCRQLSQFLRADPEYGWRVAAALGLAPEDISASTA
jgi:catalase